VRHAHLPQTAVLLTLAVLLAGPATGVERAIHLAEAGHEHAAHACAVCIDLACGAPAVELAAPATLTALLPARDRCGVAAQCSHHTVAAATPLVPRAPPA